MSLYLYVYPCARYLTTINNEIRPIFRPIDLVGQALTNKIERAQCTKRKENSESIMTIAKENSQHSDVIILVCGGYRHGDSVHGGENSKTACQVRGAIGAVIDGACRDTRKLSELKMPVFIRFYSPGGRGGSLYTIDYNVPMVCGGILVNPGDIVVGDGDGVCIIPKEIEEEALKAVKFYGELDSAVAPALREGK